VIRVYTAALKVALMSACVAVTTLSVLAVPTAWAHLHHDAVIPVAELSRLSACDQAAKAAERYDLAKAQGANADAELPGYWFAKAQCNAATPTVQAAR